MLDAERKSARNFNQPMCSAAGITIAEVEEIVEDGHLDPNQVHVPSICVHRIYKAPPYQKRIEVLHPTHSVFISTFLS